MIPHGAVDLAAGYWLLRAREVTPQLHEGIVALEIAGYIQAMH